MSRHHSDSEDSLDFVDTMTKRKVDSSSDDEEPPQNVFKISNSHTNVTNPALAQFVLPDQVLKEKTKKWRQVANKRFSDRRKHGY